MNSNTNVCLTVNLTEVNVMLNFSCECILVQKFMHVLSTVLQAGVICHLDVTTSITLQRADWVTHQWTHKQHHAE